MLWRGINSPEKVGVGLRGHLGGGREGMDLHSRTQTHGGAGAVVKRTSAIVIAVM